MGKFVSYVIPVWNKVRYVEAAIRCALAQTYSPMELVISDHGSTDGTLDVIERVIKDYSGPHKIRFLQFDDIEYRGMAGWNRHMNFIMPQLDSDIVTAASGDDICKPNKIERVMDVFDKFNPTWVSCTMGHVPEDNLNAEPTISFFEDRRSRFITTAEAIRFMVGTAAQPHWQREFWEKYAPLNGIECFNVSFPILATLHNGFYFLDEDLHTFIQRAGLEICGIESQVRAAKNDIEREQSNEIMCFQYSYHWMSLLKRLHAGNHASRLGTAEINALNEQIVRCCSTWAEVREKMALSRIQPISYRV